MRKSDFFSTLVIKVVVSNSTVAGQLGASL